MKERNDQKKSDGGDDNARKVISLYNSQNTEKRHTPNPKLLQMFLVKEEKILYFQQVH